MSRRVNVDLVDPQHAATIVYQATISEVIKSLEKSATFSSEFLQSFQEVCLIKHNSII